MGDNEYSEEPVLSSAALDALTEFYVERDAQKKRFEDLKGFVDDSTGESFLTMDVFAEDWNQSQFWYSQETATILASQLLANSSSETTIAVISAPSVFVQLKPRLAANKISCHQKPKIHLLEYDERFAVFPEFTFYDFHKPLKLPPSMKGTVDHIICDPPFLSEDCQTKVAMTVRWLSRSWGRDSSRLQDSQGNQLNSQSRLIVCTGERMGNLVNKLYRPQGIATTTFYPAHAKGLSNKFYCYANFECDDWKWSK